MDLLDLLIGTANAQPATDMRTVGNFATLAPQLQSALMQIDPRFMITSGYRTPEHNRAVGGVPNSAHLDRRGADVVPIGGMNSQQVQQIQQQAQQQGLKALNEGDHIHIQTGNGSVNTAQQPQTFPTQSFANQTPISQTANIPQQPPLTINPQSLLPPQPPTMGSGMRTLMSVLATIGAMGGVAGNIIGGIRRSGPVGNGALQAAGGIFNMLNEQQQAQNQYQQLQSIANDPNMSNDAKVALLLGDKQGLAQNILNRSDPTKQLQQQRLVQEVENGTPEGIKKRAMIEAQAKQDATDILLKQFTDLEQKPNRTPGEENQYQLLKAQLKQGPPTNQSAVYEKLTQGDHAPIGEYNTAFESLDHLNKIDTILNRIPTNEWNARVKGSGLKSLLKVLPEPDVAEVSQLELILSRPFVRQGLREKGKISQQEYENTGKLLFSFMSKSPEERNRLMQNIRDIYEQNLKTNYQQINLLGSSVGEPNITKTNQNLGLIGQPEDILNSKNQASNQRGIPSNDMIDAELAKRKK